MKVISYPDNWMSFKPAPHMKGKRLGIFAHVFVNNGEQDATKAIYKNIVDVAVEEQTCLLLCASQSLIQSTHFLLYEEWVDYDEFFEVQLSRTYRNGFMRWLDPVMSAPVSPEFTEMFHSSGQHSFNIAYNAYVLVQSVHIKQEQCDQARQLFADYIDDVGKDSQNIVATAHQSINNPQHFLIYEVWSDFSHLVEIELSNERRMALISDYNKLKDGSLTEPSQELFQIYYDPSKYVHP